MRKFITYFTLFTLGSFYSINLAQNYAGYPPNGIKYKTFTSCVFENQFKIELHDFPETGPRGAKQHLIAYIKDSQEGKWLRTRIYLPFHPIEVPEKQRDLSPLRSPASEVEITSESKIKVYYFKDDLQKPVRSSFPRIDSQSGVMGIIQGSDPNGPVSMVLRGHFHHWEWGPHARNLAWSSYKLKQRKETKSILLQKKFYDMAYSTHCYREFQEI